MVSYRVGHNWTAGETDLFIVMNGLLQPERSGRLRQVKRISFKYFVTQKEYSPRKVQKCVIFRFERLYSPYKLCDCNIEDK